jgi:protein-S-isoprenylcysteine O-methyltransferase Ste14
MHVPPAFEYDEAILFWGVFVISFSLEIARSGVIAGCPANAQDRGTLRLINLGSDAALLLAFGVSFLPWFAIPLPRLALWIGTVLLVAGAVLRRWCIGILGRYFTAAVTVEPGQPVIQDGPYRLVRHPSYAAGFLMFLGIGIALGSWLAVLVFVVEIVVVYGHRVEAEETALLETIGEPYRSYMGRTKRFIPFVY